jgi:2-ketocyclohexanecarboxyl-CoA hydrolase
MSNFEDILYEVNGRTATITINRPKKYNAFRPRTVVELIDAFQLAGWDKDIGSIVFTGAGGKAFCTGGDQSDHEGGQYGNNDARGAVGMTIASDNAIFGQVGPKMGSVDPGFGTAYLARVVGEKKAREIWYMCKRYSAQEALEMGLANAVYPDDQLDAEVQKWCDELNKRSPTAIALAKKSFNADTESIRGLSQFALQAVKLYYWTEESQEGVKALNEKREPDFMKFYK